MYLLITDETNLQADKADFFTYGGLIISADQLAKLHLEIENLRLKYGYKPTDRLKFDTNARPKHVSVEAAAELKRAVIKACINADCKFIAYVVLHAIAKKDVHTLVKWGSDHVIGKFNYFLSCHDSHGIVAMDRLPDGVEFEYLANKFSHGLSLPNEGVVPLDKIVLFSSTCINASHLSSAMDVVLGSWRYCINQPANSQVAQSMMKAITKLIWCERDGDDIYAFEKGLIFRPKTVSVERYQRKYDDLLNSINKLLID